MKLPFPLAWLALTAMWLVLNRTLAPRQVILGMLVALAAVLVLRALQVPGGRKRRPLVALRLAGAVIVDIVRSNVAVAGVVLRPDARGRSAGFVAVPLELRHPTGLAVLACIITSTPGTSWAGYDSRSGVLTMHILDLVDHGEWLRTVKERYESPLLEIFG
jgi:multicomponent K+:H+ antiporter subunit E